MVVRVLTCEVDSPKRARAWAREHTDLPREVAGLEEVTFLCSRRPPRAGAVLVFASDDDLARYLTTGGWRRLRRTLRQAGAHCRRPVHDETYRVLQV